MHRCDVIALCYFYVFYRAVACLLKSKSDITVKMRIEE